MTGRLILCATPIGNLEDASPRLASTLREADNLYAEDTRRTATLLRHLEVARSTRSYFAGNEAARSSEISQLIGEGATVVLVTDAGMPSIADPGHSAVRAALEAGGVVEALPGPSAVTTALAVSGMPADRFVFEGFLPRKGKARASRLELLGSEQRTLVLFASPNRVVRDLVDLARELGDDRPVAVARELTKLHEEVWRGTLRSAADRWNSDVDPRGEFTLVVAGKIVDVPAVESLVGEVADLVATGASSSDAVRAVANRHGVSRRDLYETVVTTRGDA